MVHDFVEKSDKTNKKAKQYLKIIQVADDVSLSPNDQSHPL